MSTVNFAPAAPCAKPLASKLRGRAPGTSVARLQRSVPARAASTGAPASAPAVGNGSAPARASFRTRERVVDILGDGQEGRSWVGQEVLVKGWVRTLRDQSKFAFLSINDGSNMAGIQAVINAGIPGHELIGEGKITTGCAVAVRGEVVESPGGKQAVEVKAEELVLVGECDASTYPLQKKRHTLEFLRDIAHLRPRTNTIAAVARVRSALAAATHEFFTQHGFVYVHTPILSASDCEGAGEMFQVTTLMPDGEAAPDVPPEDLPKLRAGVEEQGGRVRDAKAAAKADGADKKAAKAKVEAEVKELLALKEKLAAAESAATGGIPRTPEGAVDYSGDFFAERVSLTVSGQLNAEMYACALGDVYTFGPTFRAENSHTARHLAEFWMIEPEMAFCTLAEDVACAEAYVQHCVNYILQHCAEDLKFFGSFVDKTLLARLEAVASQPFAKITYTEGVDLLLKAQEGGVKFEYPVEWGNDLQSEHERYICEKAFDGRPVVVTDYPKDIKAFYMRLNDDNKTVAAMDILVPGVGELVGGSQREDRMDVLVRRMEESGLAPEDYWWYTDLRRYGSVPHAGFGLGFERLVQFCTGVENIRDVIPFPRWPGSCKF
ncbi:unnamed protein product [Pedinophyceae sp. YPF-701]|nr:unnamed protein product [Pedinophyceae sp. YPF-701]